MNVGKNIALWVLIGIILLAVFSEFQNSDKVQESNAVAYSDFMGMVEKGTVRSVTIQGRQVVGQLQGGESFSTYMPADPDMVTTLRTAGVKITAEPVPENAPSFWSIVVSWFPMLLLIGVWIYLMRQMQGGGGKAMGFGKSRAKLLTEHQGRVTFEDVAGIDEAKDELEEVVEFLRDPQKFQRLGGRIPKGVLLIGPPGTGKTLLARAIAGEANVPFFTISGSDFVEMFVGVGASRVRDMFEQGKKNAPCIIFIDEIDAVGRHRGAGLGGGNDEREQTLNQLLVEMDGFESTEGVILIAATNRPDVLDPALLRPGRFDREVHVPNPDVGGREQILRVHMRKVPLGADVDPKILARGTPGFSGADLANLVNEAALMAARRSKRVVTMSEFEEAKDKVMMGAERRSMVLGPEEKRLTAYHEAGHALVQLQFAVSDPIHKATIIPRGRAMGLVMGLPEKDRYSMSKEFLEARIAVAMAGRLSEEMIFGPEKVTNGAQQDIRMATAMARAMVMQWGMSELGPLAYEEPDQEVFLGHSVSRSKTISDETARKVDDEIRRLVEEGNAKARAILTEQRDRLEIIARGLLEYETLSGEEIKALLRGEAVVREDPAAPRSRDGGRRTSVPAAGGQTPVAEDAEPQPEA
ncbi:MAG: ATP-dependent zinc metalloprotease FtsH [Rhodospirillaceae bacterium]|nr:ATP-dependent zinc metalloprotease FtsH [Rhodospirillaceae bacterium]